MIDQNDSGSLYKHLRRYAAHIPTCRNNFRDPDTGDRWPCDCGLTELIERAKAADAEKPAVLVIRHPDYEDQIETNIDGAQVYYFDWGAGFNGPRDADDEQRAEECSGAIQMAESVPSFASYARRILDTFGCDCTITDDGRHIASESCDLHFTEAAR